MYGEGISVEGDIIDLAQQYGVIEKSGSWFAFEGEKLGQGRDNTRLFLKEHPELVDKLRKKIQAKVGQVGGLPAAEASAALLLPPSVETVGTVKRTASIEEEDSDSDDGSERPHHGKDAHHPPRDKGSRHSAVRAHSKKGD